MHNLLTKRITLVRAEGLKSGLYLGGSILYVAVMAFENSTASILLPENLFTLIKIAALGLLCGSLFIPKDVPVWYIVVSILMICFSAGLYATTTSTLPLFFVSMAFGSYGVERKKVFSSIALTTVVSAAIIVTLALGGIIPNVIRTNNYGLLKYDMGFGYGSQPSQYIETVAICVILANDGELSKRKAAGIALAALVAFLLWNFITSFLITVVLLVLVLVVQGVSPKEKTRDLLKSLSSSIYPIVAVVTIALTACFNASNQLLSAMDRMLSWRLTLGKQALDWYGVQLFGQPVYFKGFGIDAAKSTIIESGSGNYELVDANAGYTYVDSSYVLYLILLGIVFLLVSIGVYAAISRMAAEHSSLATVILLMLLAVQCSINPLLVETYVNPAPILLGLYSQERYLMRKSQRLQDEGKAD